MSTILKLSLVLAPDLESFEILQRGSPNLYILQYMSRTCKGETNEPHLLVGIAASLQQWVGICTAF